MCKHKAKEIKEFYSRKAHHSDVMANEYREANNFRIKM